MLNWNAKSTKQILVYFLTNPQRTHHLRELSAILDIDPGNLSRSMKTLTDMGLFQFSEKGRLKFFSINTQHPLYKDIKGIILKTQGTAVLIKQALRNIMGIQKVFLYGSFAQGSADEKSDIDLMMIGRMHSMKIASLLRPLEKRLGREIHYRIMDENEFKKRLKKNDPFLKSVMKKKIIPLIGSL